MLNKQTHQAKTLGRYKVPKNLYYIVGLVALDKVLLAGFDSKRLYAETPSGTSVDMGDVAALNPSFIDQSHAQMSAVEPRRILYQVDGCLLGDFDDCYGVVFHRFAVFDSQTSKMLVRHTYQAGADLKIFQTASWSWIRMAPMCTLSASLSTR